MARRSTRPQPDPPRPDAERQEVVAIEALFARQPRTLAVYHAIGEQMHELKEGEAHTGYGSRWRKDVAAAVEQSDSTLTKCLQFFNTYKRDDIAELEEVGVGWVGLIIALGVRDKKKRHQLLRRAKDEGWGQKELQREVRQLKGSIRGGGRPRKREKSRGCLADAAEMARWSAAWSAFYRQAWAGNEGEYLAEVVELSGNARGSMEKALADAEAKLKALRGQCVDALKDVKTLRENLPPEE